MITTDCVTDVRPNSLSLYTGAGGGLLGEILLGWRCIGYVEIDDYCQEELSKRIKDKILPEAPIFTDIDLFISKGYAKSYKGVVDVITGGFPCQPFSVAGKRKGENDPRNKWPATLRTISIIRPQIAFLENVPGLFADKYIRRIFGDLAEIGYDCIWSPLSAAACGAPHPRNRQWIVAYPNKKRLPELFFTQEPEKSRTGFDWISLQNMWRQRDPDKALIRRGVHGFPGRVDRIKALGNAQVPIVVKTVFELLINKLKDGKYART